MSREEEKKENWVKAKKVFGLLVLWIFMPATAFFKITDLMQKKTDKDDKAPDENKAPDKNNEEIKPAST